MSLADFEARMLKLKGVKLPAVSIVGVQTAKQAKVVHNKLAGTILANIDEEYITDEALDDIITGMVRSYDVAYSHKGNKLNVAVIRSILHKLSIISTRAIADNFGYSRSQAKHYSQCCRIVLQFKGRSDVKQSFYRLALSAS